MKKALKIVFWVILGIILIAVLFIGWLTLTEYRPNDVEALDISGESTGKTLAVGDEVNVLSWNIGYAGLGKNSDFFMDGGTHTQAADKATVQQYLSGISDTLSSNTDTDIYMLQEVDVNSTRTYHIDERTFLSLAESAHAPNHICPFVPSGWPPIGKVYAGLFTTTNYDMESAERVSLPCPFSWPTRAANLKRCLLVSYLPIEGTDAKLCLINLHLEAYDNGEGKIAQTNQLRILMQEEYEKGNYVLAGGDFNQIFPGSEEYYPNTHEDLWLPGVLSYDILPNGWGFAYDVSTPSCRLLNQPYDPDDTENTHYYLIDGFIVSPNLYVDNVQTLDCGFENSDHNPVKITVRLLDEPLV